MIELQDIKLARMADPQNPSNAIRVGGVSVDTLGYDYAVCVVQLGVSVKKMQKCQIKQSDTSLNAVTWNSGTDIIADFGNGSVAKLINAANPAVPNTNSTLHSVMIDLRGKKRYIGLSGFSAAAAANGSWISAFCILGRSAKGAASQADLGVTQAIRV